MDLAAIQTAIIFWTSFKLLFFITNNIFHELKPHSIMYLSDVFSSYLNNNICLWRKPVGIIDALQSYEHLTSSAREFKRSKRSFEYLYSYLLLSYYENNFCLNGVFWEIKLTHYESYQIHQYIVMDIVLNYESVLPFT